MFLKPEDILSVVCSKKQNCTYKTNDLFKSKELIVDGLLDVLSIKDYIANGHAMRLHNVCISVGKKIGLSTSQLTDLKLLAKIHDIGKLGIPDSILFKKGKLNKYEWEIMQTHTIIGFNIVKQFPLLNNIAYLILMHHERWDGFGYPLGLKEENVPIECRILSIIDAFDAMTNDRPYRSAMDSNEAINEIEKGTGTQFDPDIAKTFLKLVN